MIGRASDKNKKKKKRESSNAADVHPLFHWQFVTLKCSAVYVETHIGRTELWPPLFSEYSILRFAVKISMALSEDEDSDTGCCYAITAECRACSVGLSVTEYCKKFPDTPGCHGKCIYFAN